jgi:hypothetical protein
LCETAAPLQTRHGRFGGKIDTSVRAIESLLFFMPRHSCLIAGVTV